MPEPEFVRQYNDLVNEEAKSMNARTIGIIDQNIALLRETASSIGLNLHDPDTLNNFTRALALILSWNLNHIHASCTVRACLEASDAHVRVAASELGVILREMQKNTG